MKCLKEKKGIIISFIMGAILTSSITVFAYGYLARDISYTKPGTETKISVETALNDLYNKRTKTPEQVATLTTKNASYTFQNDGYIIGTVTPDYPNSGGMLFVNSNEPENYDNLIFIAQYNLKGTRNCSIYVTKGTTIYTRKEYGTYNLICYEFK